MGKQPDRSGTEFRAPLSFVTRPPGVAVDARAPFYRWAVALACITVFYNIIEGCVSIFFGLQDETIALFGFGLDSFVEVISGIGIWHMVRRMRQSDPAHHDRFERRALQITGGAFYLLAAGLTATAAINIYRGSRPEHTFWGIVVSVISILSMGVLIHYKVKIGKQYNSAALLADAHCSRACMYLSIVLLVSSVGYEVTALGALDALGALGIAVFAFREGREAFGKAAGTSTCGCQGGCG